MPDRTNDPLAIALLAEIAAVDQLARSRLAKALPKGMELSHFMVLGNLDRMGEKTPAQLAKTFNVTKGAMTNTLSKLEVAGYIHIRPDWDDARRKLVSISTAGRTARSDAVRAVTPWDRYWEGRCREDEGCGRGPIREPQGRRGPE